MKFDWKDYISLAEHLYDTSEDQAFLRSSISRAYYGAFGKIKSYTEANHNLNKGLDGIHRAVIEALKRSSNSKEFSLGNTLNSLRDSRNSADYDSHVKITRPQVYEVLRKSKSAMELLDDIENSDL